MPFFDRGDIVSMPINPTLAEDERGSRIALVLTTQEFNKLGDVLVVPITQGADFARYAGFAVSLSGNGCHTQGVALLNKIRMVDLVACNARTIERAPATVVDEALARLAAMIE